MKRGLALTLFSFVLCFCLILVSCDKVGTRDDEDVETELTEEGSSHDSVDSSDTTTDSSGDTLDSSGDTSDSSGGSVSSGIGSDNSTASSGSGIGTTDSSRDTTDSKDDSTDSSVGSTDSSIGTSDSSWGTTDSSTGSTDSSQGDNDGEDDTHVHKYGSIKVIKAATCTEGGSMQKECECGHVVTLTVNPLGHKEEIVKGTATCTEGGTSDGVKCSSCGEILLEQENVGPLGHTEEIVAGTEPTCTESGLSEGKKCSVCDFVFIEQTVVDALGHSFGDWQTVTPPGCVDVGKESRACHCGEAEERDVPATGHLLDKTGLCQSCKLKITGNSVVISLDVSSSMRELMSDGKSRFQSALDFLTSALYELDETTMVTVVAFDANLHVILEPQFLPLSTRESTVKKIERQLLHTYYYYYLDENGKETEIPVSYNDGDKYTSAGLVRPIIDRNELYDKENYYLIRTYGTAYYSPISYASTILSESDAIERSMIFISDGAPSDRGSGYQDIVKALAEKGIKTSTIFVGSYSTNSTSHTEINLLCENGGGKAYHANTSFDFINALWSLLEIDSHYQIDENGFVFAEYNGVYYLVGYKGEASHIVLPEYFNEQPYSLKTNSISGLEFVNSITFPANITSIPSYAITDCKHLYTVKFLAESTNVNSLSFDGCIRLTEAYGTFNGSLKNFGLLYKHDDLTEESYITVFENGLVFALTNNYFVDLIDYVGDQKDLFVEIPEVLINDPTRVKGYIGYYALYDTEIERVTFSSYFNQVFDYAFASCENLTTVVFEGVIRFNQNQYLFKDSPYVEFLVAEEYETPNFNISYCPNIVIICTKDKAPTISEATVITSCTGYGITENGLKWISSSNTDGVVILRYLGKDQEVTIPETINGLPVTEIYDEAFISQTEITKITLPNGLKRIKTGAFAFCSALAEMNIPSSVEFIGSSAFLDCEKLLVEENSVLYVGNWAVGFIAKETVVYLKKSTVGVSCLAFNGWLAFEEINIPTGVIYVCENAFAGCKNAIILCGAYQKLDTWSENWNPESCDVIWGVCQDGHTWLDANCTKPQRCIACPAITGEPLGHTTIGNGCTELYACERCGEELLGTVHSWSEATCTEDSVCQSCGEKGEKAKGHRFGDDGNCERCDAVFSEFVVSRDEIDSLTASHDDYGAPYIEHLFDGDKSTAGIYEYGNEYYGEVGDYVTITLKDETVLHKATLWGCGIWVYCHLYFYDEYGSLQADHEVILSKAYDGAEEGEKIELALNNICVKTIVLEITQLKWGNVPRTCKISELEFLCKKVVE